MFSHRKQRKYFKPDFIGVGPPKTGTTWLYKVLSQCPDITMPPMKEVGYLWAHYYLPNSSYIARFTGKHWYFRGRQGNMRNFLRRLATDLRRRNRIEKDLLLFFLKYASFPHSLQFYSKLFARDSVAGEITPKYCELQPRAVRGLAAMFPTTKVIITLRDPIAREWSRAKMNLAKKPGRRVSEIEENEWIEHFDDPLQVYASDYLKLVERWTSAFGEERVIVLFQEDIAQDPNEVMSRVGGFLGVDVPAMTEEMKKPVTKGVDGQLPLHLQRYLVEKHYECICRFAMSFDASDHPKSWMERYSEMASSGKAR